MTKNLKLFAICTTLWTIVYSAILYNLLQTTTTPDSSMVALFVLFTVLLSGSEKYFSSRDDKRKVRYNLSLRYSVIAALASVIATSFWAIVWQHNMFVVLVVGVLGSVIVLAIVHTSTR